MGWCAVRQIVIAASVAALTLSRADAASVDLSAYKGKLVYLDFWASWCAPCRQSFPWLSDLERRYGPNRLVVVGVNLDHDRAKAERFLKETPANFAIVYDPDGQAASEYKVKAMPSSFLIDGTGRLRFEHHGFSPKDTADYEAQITSLLAEHAHP